MTNRRPYGAMPQKAVRVRPGQCLLRMRICGVEDRDDAIRRAQTKEWWPRVVRRDPVLSRGWWVWIGRVKGGE